MHPDDRRQGWAAPSSSSSLYRARRRGASVITLEVRARTWRAMELYRDIGFRAVALRRGYYAGTARTRSSCECDLEAAGRANED